MIIQDTPRINVVLEMERLIGEDDWAAAAAHFTPSVAYYVGAQAPRRGIGGIRDYMIEQNRFAKWVGHEPRKMVEIENAVIIEVDSFFVRLADEKRITLPCTDIYRFDDMQIDEWRVYSDLSAFLSS